MAGYIVYVNVDLLRLATEQSVTTTLARLGFKRVVRRSKDLTPLATLLFVGDSHLSTSQFTRHLETELRHDTMCDVYVIVFPLKMLGSRPALHMQSDPMSNLSELSTRESPRPS